MANIPNKTKITTAVSNSSQQNLDCVHVTTSNFMELNVAKAMELVPRQSIKVNHSLFTRLEPMPVPTFGMASIHSKAFFVPYRTVFPGWNDFINDVPHTYPDGSVGHISTVPLIKNSQFINFFKLNEVSREMPAAYADNADFVIAVGGQAFTAYKFTPFGRRVFKILTSLGYKFSFNAQDEDFMHSALPLLSLIKVYIDWYFPNNYSQIDVFTNLEQFLKYDKVEPFYDDFTFFQLLQVFTSIDKVCYDSDYFVSSWDNPVSPNSGSYSDITLTDVTQVDNPPTTTTVGPNGTPVLTSGNSVISQYMLNGLRAITDYLRRHQISGSRVIDRYLARWGVTLDSAKLDRSLYINGYNQELRFGDVTATADTEGANLGSYSGKGVSYGDGFTDFSNNDEFGHFIIISSIVPETSYYQGCDRCTRHISKLDFYTPEFDNLGVQAMSTHEIFLPMDSRKMYATNSESFDEMSSAEKVFAFVPRYGEYKRSFNVLSGDYILGSLNAGKDSWTLFRDVDSYFKEKGMDTKHSYDFVLGEDSEQYNRIFYNVNDNADHFNVIHNFSIESNFPGKSLFDTYEFENEDEAAKVTLDAGGVKAN